MDAAGAEHWCDSAMNIVGGGAECCWQRSNCRWKGAEC